jgi:pimeloyl-ACP methyl ester carboxylesterase|tara:strand:- start:3612 stop:4394 length:783 start_codon:yes stop_codon:yes gene_type:complete
MIVKLNSKIVGEGGIPLLVLHGLFGMGDNWASHARAWSLQGFEVHLLDLRNHGRSPHASSHTYADLVEDLKKYVDSHFTKNTSIRWIGHSMGGKALMEFSAKYPELVEKMVVVDIGPKYYAVQHSEIIEAMHLLDLDKLKSRTDADRSLEIKIPEWGLRQFILKNLEWKTDKKLGWKLNLPIIESQISRIGEEMDKGKSFVGSVLFIRGMNSKYILDKDWTNIMRYFPLAQLDSIPDAGHWVHSEKPQEFQESLKDFLNI